MKRFERSNGLDTALYKNYLYLFLYSAELFITTHVTLNINDMKRSVPDTYSAVVV